MIENHTPQDYEPRHEATPFANGDAIDVQLANPDLLSNHEARLLGAAAELAMMQQREARQVQMEQTPQAYARQASLWIVKYRDDERAA